MELAKRHLSDRETASIEFAYVLSQESASGVGSSDAAPAATRVVTDAAAVREPSLKTNDGEHGTRTRSVTLTLTRDDLDRRAPRSWTAPPRRVRRPARRGGVGVKEITDVVLVGGSSRLAAVRARLAAIFGEERLAREGDTGPDPETAVAGAARSYAC